MFRPAVVAGLLPLAMLMTVGDTTVRPVAPPPAVIRQSSPPTAAEQPRPTCDGLLERARSDRTFRARVAQSATRVVELKSTQGLVACRVTR